MAGAGRAEPLLDAIFCAQRIGRYEKWTIEHHRALVTHVRWQRQHPNSRNQIEWDAAEAAGVFGVGRKEDAPRSEAKRAGLQDMSVAQLLELEQLQPNSEFAKAFEAAKANKKAKANANKRAKLG